MRCLQTSPALCPTPGAAVQQQERTVQVVDFEAVFLHSQSAIATFLFRIVGNRELSYDLAQDVFVKAYKTLLGGTIVQETRLSAWLFRIVTNTAYDVLRRRRLISWLPLSLYSDDRGIGAGIISASGGSALWLSEREGFSYAEIAGILNISAPAVKMRVMRARERFITFYRQEKGGIA